MVHLSCSYTGVGSLPFKDPKEAVSYVFDRYEIPFLPQLPKRSFREQMIYQYIEDFPGLVQNTNHCFVDVEMFSKILRDSQGDKAGAQDDNFSFSFLSSLDLFLQKTNSLHLPIKVQVTSPYTIASHLTCSDKKLLIDHHELYPYLIDYLGTKLEVLLKKFEKKPLLVFFDEPMLTTFHGKEIFKILNRLVQRLKTPYRLFGLHSCNQWSFSLFKMAFQSQFDILNFDVQLGFNEIFEDKKYLLDQLEKKWIMWGIISTSRKDIDVNEDFFIHLLKNKSLKKEETKIILNRSLFSLACGTALLSLEQEKKCAMQLKEIAVYSKTFL